MAGRRVHIHISGRVQGVGFRYSTVDAAEDRGVAGWVRNLPDGKVEAVAEGDPSALQNFVAWCRAGPPGSRVDRVDEEWTEATGEFVRFEIRR